MTIEKPRVLMILTRFPQHSETYIKTEIAALKDDYDIRVVCLHNVNLPYSPHHPYERLTKSAPLSPARIARALVKIGKKSLNKVLGDRLDRPEWWDANLTGVYDRRLLEIIGEFRPHVMHTHYLHNASLLGPLARRTNVPFTVRGHSYCIMDKQFRNSHTGSPEPSRCTRRAVPDVNDPLCLGVLTFPFTQPAMEKAGIRPDKIIPCHPVMNHAMFDDPGPNGEGVLNVAPALPKKGIKGVVDLGCMMPDTEINIYAIGQQIEKLRSYNEQLGSPVKVFNAVPQETMPGIYKRHGWMIYTADRDSGNCGWPLSVGEAQASGLGVCVSNVHPNSIDQLGGAGFVFDSIDDVARIISQPYPDEMRKIGFKHAKKSDIQRHKHLLTDLWAKVI